MGYLVEKLSGMSFGEFLRTRLFEPLGMTRHRLLRARRRRSTASLLLPARARAAA